MGPIISKVPILDVVDFIGLYSGLQITWQEAQWPGAHDEACKDTPPAHQYPTEHFEFSNDSLHTVEIWRLLFPLSTYSSQWGFSYLTLLIT